MSKKGRKLVSDRRYTAGWLDSSIHDWFEEFPETYKSMAYVFITCLDSNPDPASLLDTSLEFKTLMVDARPLGRGLLLPTERLLEIESRAQIFFGFDEVWFFPGESVTPKPESVWLVGPGRIDQETLNRLGAWMAANSCTLALGDGEGLNFIVKATGLFRHLFGLSKSQPAPTLGSGLVFDKKNAGGSSVQ